MQNFSVLACLLTRWLDLARLLSVHSVSKKQTRSVLLTTARGKLTSAKRFRICNYKQHWLTVLAREKRPCYPEANWFGVIIVIEAKQVLKEVRATALTTR